MMLDWQCRLLEHYRGEMAEMGLEVVPSTDFEALEAIVRRMSPKGNGELTPHFSTRENTFTTQDAFWIGVWYEKRCIGVVASKLQSLGDEKLGAYIRRYWNRVYQAGSTHDFEFDDWQKDVLSSYSGDIIYSGEFRVHPEYQGRHFAEPMAMFLRVYSFLRWGSLASRVQMTIQIPDALNWRVPPSQAKPDYWLCGMERDHYRDFVRQWAESQKPRVSTTSQIAVIHRRS